MTLVKGKFDVHIDSNHRWDTDRVMEIDAYPLLDKGDGTYEPDMSRYVASIRIPAGDIRIDTWIDNQEASEIWDLPKVVRDAYNCVIILANSVQKESF